MIAFLTGKLLQKDPTHLIVDVSGVGYFVKISLQTFADLKESSELVKIHTVLIVREDSQTLFGFSTFAEKELFEHLISVSGIGPSIALVMLSSLSSREIQEAIITEDLKTIQGIKGIGLKTAQRAIIELKDKLQKHLVSQGENIEMFTKTDSSLKAEALTALTTLGLNRAAAEKNINTILKRTGNDITLEELIKLALR